MRGLYEMERGWGWRRACPNSMGTVVLRPVRMRRALGPTRRRRSAGCGLVLLLPLGPSAAVSSAAAFPRSFLPDAGLSPAAAEGRARCNAETAPRAVPGHVGRGDAAGGGD